MRTCCRSRRCSPYQTLIQRLDAAYIHGQILFRRLIPAARVGMAVFPRGEFLPQFINVKDVQNVFVPSIHHRVFDAVERTERVGEGVLVCRSIAKHLESDTSLACTCGAIFRNTHWRLVALVGRWVCSGRRGLCTCDKTLWGRSIVFRILANTRTFYRHNGVGQKKGEKRKEKEWSEKTK